MSVYDEMDLSIHVDCPNCQKEFDGLGPSCNECECCFCSELCRKRFHDLREIEHDFDQSLEDLS